MSTFSISSCLHLFEEFHLNTTISSPSSSSSRKQTTINKPSPTIPFPTSQIKKRLNEVAAQFTSSTSSTSSQSHDQNHSTNIVQSTADLLVRSLYNDLTKIYSPAFLHCVSALSGREEPFCFDVFGRVSNPILGDTNFSSSDKSPSQEQLKHQHQTARINDGNRKVAVISIDVLQRCSRGEQEIATTLLCLPHHKMKDIVSNPKFVRCFNQHLQTARTLIPQDQQFLSLVRNKRKDTSSIMAKPEGENTTQPTQTEMNFDTLRVGDLHVGAAIVYRHLGLSCDHIVVVTSCEYVSERDLEAKIQLRHGITTTATEQHQEDLLPCLVFTRKHIGSDFSDVAPSYTPYCDACRMCMGDVALYGCRLVPNHPSVLCEHCNAVLHAANDEEDSDCFVMKLNE